MYNFLIGMANVLMVFTSLFLICLVLIQRGKGGGLAGAFGGVGGSSAFGTKAGDVFTRVTIYVAGFWFLLALFLVYTSNTSDRAQRGGAFAGASADEPSEGATPVPSESGSAKTPKTTAGGSDVDKAPASPPPSSKAPTKPAEPLNPANAALKPTSDVPPVTPKEAPAKSP